MRILHVSFQTRHTIFATQSFSDVSGSSHVDVASVYLILASLSVLNVQVGWIGDDEHVW